MILIYIGLPSAYFAIPLSALILIRAFYLRITKKVLLTINSEGLRDDSTPGSPGLIKWAEVGDVLMISFLGQKLIGIVLKDSNSLRSRVNKVKQVLMKVNELTVKAVSNGEKVGVPVVIGPRMLDQPASEIIKIVHEHLK